VGDLAAGTIRVDSDAIRIALDALVENAVAHTADTDAIELRTRATGNSVTIEVADEGRGIPADVLDRIFERFGRPDPGAVRSGGGVGLGLAIVDAIAKAHGGRCTVTSSPHGSTFALTLPGFTQAPWPLTVAATPAVESGNPA
jgi:signal transduction histidine kinase